MAQDKETIKLTYPLPVYNYRVTFLMEDEAVVIGFAEVSGLNFEYEAVTYKHGLSFKTGNIIIPGMIQPIQISLKKGLTKSNGVLYQWLQNTYLKPYNPESRRNIVIDLCDELGEPAIRWTVQGALPTKLEGPSFDANSDDVAIETMELVAQSLKIDTDL